jgi:AcrR family transcriptional regulator
MPRRPYHHGNLRSALLAAALRLIAESGPEAFTLREVARRAGVSHNAPYRHFRNKADLLAAVAAEGFERLAASMDDAMRRGTGAAERPRLAGEGYIRFAQRYPQHLRVMFDLPAAQKAPAAYGEAARRAFQVLADCVRSAQAEGLLPPGDVTAPAWAAWAAVHGLAKLAISGHLPFDAKATLAFTSYLTAVLGEGLARVPASLPPSCYARRTLGGTRRASGTDSR